MGNALSNASDHPEQLAKFEPAALASQVHLNTASYLTDSSDVVALLVLAHQTQMHNLITLTNYRTRLTQNSEQDGFEPAAEKLVRYMLFANEAALAEPLARNSSFAVDFAARGPFDSHGRSLRQFDLQKRIFRYPCSYLIYSETFDALPEPAKGYVLHRLFEVLSGEDQGADFQALSAADRRAILEILVETKPGLPPEWPFFLEHLKEQTAAVQQRAAR
jgi:hypothetical protein